MSNGEFKVLESDVVIFPMKSRDKSEEQILVEAAKIEVSETQAETKNFANQKTNMFARLKKSARKKSISIL